MLYHMGALYCMGKPVFGKGKKSMLYEGNDTPCNLES